MHDLLKKKAIQITHNHIIILNLLEAATGIYYIQQRGYSGHQNKVLLGVLLCVRCLDFWRTEGSRRKVRMHAFLYAIPIHRSHYLALHLSLYDEQPVFR